jgi:hypothetical protein
MAKVQPFGNSVEDVAKMYSSKRRQTGFAEDERGSINPQAPQHPENRRGSKYQNDSSGWVRGEGGTAENKPYFDHRGKDGYPKKW